MAHTTPPRPDFGRNNGLLPVIAQDHATGAVLMLAWMNEAALEETLRTGRAVYFSRSRGKLWRKGEESGHVQRVRSVRFDCDGDTLLLLVEQEGAACHEGYRTCFYREMVGDQVAVIEPRLVDPAAIYGAAASSTPAAEPEDWAE
jgi:phosphoribosyl-AMP cyclohydrolase